MIQRLRKISWKDSVAHDSNTCSPWLLSSAVPVDRQDIMAMVESQEGAELQGLM